MTVVTMSSWTCPIFGRVCLEPYKLFTSQNEELRVSRARKIRGHMSDFVFVMLVKVLIAAVARSAARGKQSLSRCTPVFPNARAARRKGRACDHLHIQPCCVLDEVGGRSCTADFQTRTPPVRRVLGFVNEITPVK
jgi:hypothetical protein